MKTKVLLLVLALIFSSSFLINNCQSQWVQTDGIYGGTVNALAVSGNNIFAGT